MFKKKKETKSIFNTDNIKMTIVDYFGMVQDIAYGYIDPITGKYQPDYGMANAMMLFYNKFFNPIEDDTIEFADVFQEIVDKEEFIDAFNDAIVVVKKDFDFANAYADALAIVADKLSSVERLGESIKTTINDVIEGVLPKLSGEDVENVLKVSHDLAKSDISADDIVNSVLASKEE